MRKIIILIAFLFAFSVSTYAQNFSAQEKKLIIAPPQETLQVGEKLEYSVEWLGLPVGRIILSVEGLKEIGGNECYHIVARAMANKFMSKLYDVEYTVHTYIDKKTFYTRRFEKTRRLKDKITYMEIDFDRENKKVKYKSTGSAPLLSLSSVRQRIEDSVPATLKILDGTQDLFSSFYYFRLLEAEEGKSYSLNIYYAERNWPISLKVEKPFYRDIRNLGTFSVFGVSMQSSLSEFILGKSKMFVYFTADSRRIPIEFKFGTSIGPIRGIIQNISR